MQVLCAFKVLQGGMPIAELIGIVVGHLWYFLVDLYPLQSGRTLLKTPAYVHCVSLTLVLLLLNNSFLSMCVCVFCRAQHTLQVLSVAVRRSCASATRSQCTTGAWLRLGRWSTTRSKLKSNHYYIIIIRNSKNIINNIYTDDVIRSR